MEDAEADTSTSGTSSGETPDKTEETAASAEAETAVGTTGETSSTSTAGSEHSLDPDIVTELLDSHNYQLETSLEIDVLESQPGDIELCWDEVETDFSCRDLDPLNAFKTAAFLRFRDRSVDELRTLLTESSVPQALVDGYVQAELNPGDRCVQLSQLDFFGTPFDPDKEYVESEDHVYMFGLSTGTTPGLDIKTATFLRPQESSNTASVAMYGGCGQLKAQVRLGQLTPIRPSIHGPWPIDFSQLTSDGRGSELRPMQIDRLRIARIEGMSLSEMEANFLSLQETASDIWRLDTQGPTADLAHARHEDSGQLFSGFDTPDREASSWLLSLECTTCGSPAPLFLTLLEPE